MNYSTKKIKILVFGLTFIVFFSILFLVQFLSFKTEVSAATISEVEQYTDSDNLLYRTDNTIGDYSDELYNTTSSISNNGSAPFTLTVTADDPIVEIIPKDYFKQVGETIHIGKEYGFYINTYAVGNYNFKSDVMVFDITTDTDLVETIDQVIVEVRVIYQYEFIFLDENATMFTISSGSTNAVVQYSIDNDDGYVVAYPQLNVVSGGGYTYYFAIYSESTKYYLKDISFAGRLFNEQELNLHDGAYYNPSDDIGSFFTSYDYEYEGLAKERGEPIDPADAAFLVLNDISYVLGWIPGVNIIGNVLASPGFIYDNVSMGVDIYNACVPSLVEASSGKITATLYYQNRDDQIQYYDGNLTKTAAIVVNTGDNSVWYSTDHYATGYFRITHSALNGQVPNYTRFIREIGLKVVSEDESIVRSATGAHTYFLREKVDKELTFNASTNAYILPEGRNYFYFQPKISGYYIFEATGHTNAQLSLLNVSDQTSTNQNKKITAYLNANQKYYLESFLSDDGYGRFAIRVDVESFSASTEKSVSIKPNGNIYKLSFSKNAAYAFTSTNSNHYFQLYDQNLNMIASGSTTSLHHYLQKTETCYLRVCNKSTSTQSGTISFNEVSTIYENSSLYVSSYNELKLYKFKAPSNIPAGTYYSVSFYNFSGTINPKIYGVSTAVDTMSTSGCYVMNFSLSANQEIYFGASTSSSFYIKIAETENTLKWVVGGVEQSSNTVKLNRGTTTTIRLKINGYYFDGYIHGFYSDYYRYSGGALTIDADCPASDSLDRDPYIHLYAIRNDTPYTLNVFVGHKLTTSFSKYSDNYNYGFKWNTFTSVETDLIDII
ncbi:MAG: hypothetical protein GX638_09115, partial [Crenarchaeota archaeon]|nr:hypothetical protein [Thermoproteota archaeon]